MKYPSVSMVIKACLSLSRGNADVEQGFAKSGCILTDTNTAMSLKMLIALLYVCDGILASFDSSNATCTPGTCK